MAELPASCVCSKDASRRRQETQGIPTVFHCVLRGRRLQGPRFVLDAPGSSPATGAKSLIFLRVFADLLTIVRFREVVIFLKSVLERAKACISTVSEHSWGAAVGCFFWQDH